MGEQVFRPHVPRPSVSYLLFADDNEDMRLMVRDLLQSIGHEVALAPDGLTALAAVQAREPDLLILDLAMPGMTGFEVCRAIKRNPFTSRIPVLMLTGSDSSEHVVQGLGAGADDFVTKGSDIEIVVAHLGASSPGYPEQNDEVMAVFAAVLAIGTSLVVAHWLSLPQSLAMRNISMTPLAYSIVSP